MKKLAILFLCIASNNLSAQIGFEKRTIIDNSISAHEITEMISADIDSDGDLDIIFSHSYNVISWIENDGNPLNLNQVKVLGVTGHQDSKIAAVDLDNDGDMDIVCAPIFNSPKGITWLENLDGESFFAFDKSISSGTDNVRSLAVFDVDNDGNQDLIVGRGYPNKQVKWIKNHDNGAYFEDQQIITNQVSEPSISLADIDNDGKVELFIQSWLEGEVYLYKLFNSEFQLVNKTFSCCGNYVTTGDIDGDGDLEFLHRNEWVDVSGGQSVFSEGHKFRPSIDLDDRVIVKDLDGDSDNDILISRRDENIIAWHENTDGAGSFSDEIILSSNSQRPIVALAEDFDDDGDIDVMAASEADAKIGYFENLNNSSFSEETILTRSINYPVEAYPVDIDGDGDLDIVSASERDSKIAWYENVDGMGTFGKQRLVTVMASGASGVSAADFDGDGDLDLVSSASWGGQIAWYENLDGLGTFGDQIVISDVIDDATDLVLSDIDGDGDIDIISANTFDDEIFWFENLDGFSDFGPKKVVSNIADGVSGIISIDLDNDGDMDIASSSKNDNRIAWYRNTDGAGDFSTEIIINDQAMEASSIYTVDIDKDGDLDVFYTSELEDKAAWHENLGQASFGPSQNINSSSSGSDIKSADIDNDGHEDILTVSYEASRLFWYKNNEGDGTFGPGQKIDHSFSDPAFISIADINNDGKMDVVTGKFSDIGLFWYENLGIQYNTISGLVSFHPDGLCITDPVPVPFLMLSTETNGEKSTEFTSKDGQFIFTTLEGEVTTEIVSEIPDYFQIDPSQHTTMFTGLGNNSPANFCIQSIEEKNDLEIAIYPIGQARPGFISKYEVVLENIGTTSQNGNITLIFDENKLNLIEASQPYLLVSTNTIEFLVENLLPFNKQNIELSFQVKAPPFVDINEHLLFEVSVVSTEGDIDPDNNLFILDQLTIGSYDPNDIIVLEGLKLDIKNLDDYLHYTIRFQNTGTASAINVRVENILDEKLDLSSLKIEGLSHDGTIRMVDDLLTFQFDNINLPDSTDFENSQGHISYKIKPNSELEIGEIISNYANIYFDFNTPVKTNTATTEIYEPVISNIHQLEFDFIIYPNPSSNKINIVSPKEVSHVKIIDLKGENIKQVNNSKIIDVSDMAVGIYFCKVYSISGEFKLKKIIVNR